MTKRSNGSKPQMWYEQLSDDGKATENIADELLIQLKDEAKKCHDADVANYNIKNSKTNSSFQWMKTVMSKGVVSDKIAAYIVMIQDSPIHTLDTLSNLISMVKVGKKKECIIVVENLVELFLTNLLPPSRKLISFRERPLNKINEISSGNAITRKKYLSTWYFEDQLKETYALFVRQLNTVAHDTVDTNKEKSLIAMHKLLAGNPEQEKNLLVYIVNKLGDPSRKVASKAIYCLTQLLRQHTNMQGIVLGEIEKLLFRPNISSRAQYYGLCFLSQFYLCHETSDVARHLIEVYFSFFKACVKKGDVNSRMMSALLMGVNRAYPYAKLEMAKISDHINTMYRVVHIANFNVSLHALTLLYQVSDSSEVSDRFYSALYRKLLDPQISNTTHQAMLLSLVYKALSKDTQIERIKAMIKRLLQNAVYMQPSMACGILYIISQLLSKKRDLSALVLKASVFSTHNDEEGSEDEEERYVDVKDEDVKDADLNDEDVKNEVEEQEEVSEISNTNATNTDIKITTGWLHDTANTNKKSINKNTYDGLCRNPLFAGGQFCAYTELNFLKNHFHPTVSLFAENLLKGETIRYTGDPLKDFSLIKFLDRFVFKNPKRLEEISKQGCHPMFGKRKNYIPRGVRSLAVNSKSYLNEKQQNIPVEEQYLYTFLHKRNEEKQKQEDNDDSDVDSVASDEFEEMLDKMAGAHKDPDEDLDYMNAVGENLKSKKNKKDPKNMDNEDDQDAIGDDDEEDDIDDMDDDIDDMDDMDEEMNEEDKELTRLSDDDEDSDIVFDSEEEEEVSNKKKKVKKDDIASLFASADEFASLLEDEGGSSRAPGGSNTWSNKDNANVHQLAWEEKRNRWVKGYDSKMRKGKTDGKKFNKNKSSNKRKLPNKNNFQNKKKRVK